MAIKSVKRAPRYHVPEGLLAGWVNEARRGEEALAFEKRLRDVVERDYSNSPDLNEYASTMDAVREAYQWFKARYGGEPVQEANRETAELAEMEAEELRERQLREAAIAEELHSSPDEVDGEHWMEGRPSHAFMEHDARFDGPRSGRR